ncbi:MAG: hypothetical protein U5Q44_15120 [Dehalococcoidia bacterium]|nr:hypothetical protein [Dehalococcoidia bacterium]
MTSDARTYPANPADAAKELFRRWFGRHYARSTAITEWDTSDEAIATGTATVGRRWDVAFAVIDTLSTDTDFQFEAARAALERRLDDADRSVAIWVPRGAPVPAEEPGLSQVMIALEGARQVDEERLEIRRPVTLYLRRTSTTGSVVTALGGLQPHWAQFTNKVPGSFQLNSAELYRLPNSEDDRLELFNRIVNVASQPHVDDGIDIATEDCWTVNELESGRSYVLGAPGNETDEASASLRRGLRRSLKAAEPVGRREAAARALVVIGASTYSEQEKLSWALRGMDPRLYAGFDIIVVITDGVVRVVLEPPRNTLPWDAPLG